MEQIQGEGKRVILVGDFNGHIEGIGERGGQKEGSNPDHRTNRNGYRLKKLARECQLLIVKGSSKCEGKWTWMRGGRKSVINYALTDLPEGNIINMIIDDEGSKWGME